MGFRMITYSTISEVRARLWVAWQRAKDREKALNGAPGRAPVGNAIFRFRQRLREAVGFELLHKLVGGLENDAVHSDGTRGCDVDGAVVKEERLRGQHPQSLKTNVIDRGAGFGCSQLTGKAKMVKATWPSGGGSRPHFATCWKEPRSSIRAGAALGPIRS